MLINANVRVCLQAVLYIKQGFCSTIFIRPCDRFRPSPLTLVAGFPDGFMEHVICVANPRDGVGKTTTAVNLAASLALLERKTLLIDGDPQGAATAHMGMDTQPVPGRLHHALLKMMPTADLVVQTDLACLDLIPASIDLAQVEHKLSIKPGKELALHHVCRDLSTGYAFIIIDAPSSLGFFTICALAASNRVLVPMPCRPRSREDLRHLLDVMQLVRHQLKPDLKLLGTLFTFRGSNPEDKDPVFNRVSMELGDIAFAGSVLDDQGFADAFGRGKPALLCDMMSAASRAYIDLAEALLERLGARKE